MSRSFLIKQKADAGEHRLFAGDFQVILWILELFCYLGG